MQISVDGINTYYITYGQPRDEAVVMLHGWASSCDLFAPSAEALSERYFVLAPDMPGHGKTPEPPGAWRVDDYADFITHFITAFGLRRVILLGHSFGGRVIIKLANRPDLPFSIEKIVLVDSAGIRPEKSPEQLRKEKAVKLGKKLLSKTPGLKDKVQSMVGSADYRAASPLMREILVNTVNEDLEPLLPGVKPSTLLIWGTLDTATPLFDGEKMEALMPDAGLAKIEGGTHFAFLEAPALYIAILKAFLF